MEIARIATALLATCEVRRAMSCLDLRGSCRPPDIGVEQSLKPFMCLKPV